jgi:hypothetical protein
MPEDPAFQRWRRLIAIGLEPTMTAHENAAPAV